MQGPTVAHQFAETKDRRRGSASDIDNFFNMDAGCDVTRHKTSWNTHTIPESHAAKSTPVFPDFFSDATDLHRRLNAKPREPDSKGCMAVTLDSHQQQSLKGLNRPDNCSHVSAVPSYPPPYGYHNINVLIPHSERVARQSHPCLIPQTKQANMHTDIHINTPLSLSPPDSEAEASSLTDEFFCPGKTECQDLVVKPKFSTTKLHAALDILDHQMDVSVALSSASEDSSERRPSSESPPVTVKCEPQDLPSCSYERRMSTSDVSSQLPDIKPELDFPSTIYQFNVARNSGLGIGAVSRPTFLPLNIAPLSSQPSATSIPSVYTNRTNVTYASSMPSAASAFPANSVQNAGTYPAVMTSSGLAIPAFIANPSFTLTPPGSQPSSPESSQDSACEVSRHTPPPPYPGNPTSLVPQMPHVINLTPRGLVPVLPKPRNTHPGCTTIRYNRKNNPELEKRRIHFCDYMGKFILTSVIIWVSSFSLL